MKHIYKFLRINHKFMKRLSLFLKCERNRTSRFDIIWINFYFMINKLHHQYLLIASLEFEVWQMIIFWKFNKKIRVFMYTAVCNQQCSKSFYDEHLMNNELLFSTIKYTYYESSCSTSAKLINNVSIFIKITTLSVDLPMNCNIFH